jgi:hypothetical protein
MSMGRTINAAFMARQLVTGFDTGMQVFHDE